MTDQAEETRQMGLEADLRFHLNQIYAILNEWDADGHEEMAEDMQGNIAEWKAKLENDEGTFAD